MLYHFTKITILADMMEELDINTWNRKEHFNFFKTFEEPFFGITVDIDCTRAYKHCKAKKISFFLFYLHKSIKAVNSVDPFRYRIVENKVMIYDKINASATITRSDGTFSFTFIKFFPAFSDFEVVANKEIVRVQSTSGLNPTIAGHDVIHFSSLPWLKFTSLSHARKFSIGDSCPKISFGKMTEVNSRMQMPVSIHVHHALVDGLHVGQYVEEFQRLMDEDNQGV